MCKKFLHNSDDLPDRKVATFSSCLDLGGLENVPRVIYRICYSTKFAVTVTERYI